MQTMSRRAFSLLELMVVLAIAAVLFALGAGAYARYRSNLRLVQSTQRLASELTNLQTSARAFGQPQMRGGLELTSVANATAANVSQGSIEARVYEGSPQALRAVKRFWLCDDDRYEVELYATNVCDQPMLANDLGLVMEVGYTASSRGPYTRLFTIPINPDGSILLPTELEPARIVLSNGIQRRMVEVTRVGKIKESRLQ